MLFEFATGEGFAVNARGRSHQMKSMVNHTNFNTAHTIKLFSFDKQNQNEFIMLELQVYASLRCLTTLMVRRNAEELFCGEAADTASGLIVIAWHIPIQVGSRQVGT